MVMKEQSRLPQAALNMIRYHSFYPWHREGAYREFMGPGDEQALKDVLAFNPCEWRWQGAEVGQQWEFGLPGYRDQGGTGGSWPAQPAQGLGEKTEVERREATC